MSGWWQGLARLLTGRERQGVVQRERAGGTESYEILIEQREPIDGWTVCTVCLNVDRTATVAGKKWRCADCGIDASKNTQQALTAYLAENPIDTLEKNLKQWGNVKGVRAAYKMLRSARYKCLMTLSRRRQPPSAA